ncbi:hypothetical protein ACQ4PT_071245 [Festuca glaucescens]
MAETGAALVAAASSLPAPPPAAEKTPADDAPHLRLDWQETPGHGMESSKFSVQVHHGGYFVGSGETVSYTDEKGIAWFDNLDRNNFKMGTIDLMIDQLCYKERKFVFWCPPGKAIDELVEICFDRHCHLMSNASVECKVLLLFLHHLDDHEQQVKEELSHKGGDTDCSENSEEEENFQCDSDGDPAWYDSDYDMKEDDEDFADNVDDSEADEIVELGKQIATQHAHVPGYDDVNEADLELPVEDDNERRHKSDSDDEEYKKKKKKSQVTYKFKPFNSAGDMDDPKFKTGMVFDSVEVVRKAVSRYAINERVQIRKIRNNRIRFEAVCEGKTSNGGVCKWKFIAVKDKRQVDFILKCYVGEHTCERVWEVKELSAPFLASQYVEMFRDNDRMSLKTFARKNIHQVHKGETVRQQLWACAKSTTVASFERNMAKLKEDNPGAHAFVEEMAPNTWCRAFFSDFPKCDILLNNTCEIHLRCKGAPCDVHV